MKFTTYKHKQIAYSSEGKGTPIVLLHGFCEDSFVWNDYKQEIIDAGYRVICIDLPGFGESEVIEPTSIAANAEVVNTVLDELDVTKIILIGHSMGGYTALAFAEKYPHKLLGMGMFHSHPAADDPEKLEGRRRSIEVVREKGAPLYVKQLIPGFFAEKFARSNTFVVDKLIHRAARYQPEGIIAALEAMANRPDRSEVLRQFKRPVLFIIGKEDQAVPPEPSMAQTTMVETASVLILEGVGHMGMFEATKQTQRAILKFAEFCVQLAND